MTDGAGTTTYAYAPVGNSGALQLQQESEPLANGTIAYGYDAFGRPISRTVAGASAETFGYGTIGQLTSHTSDLGALSLNYLISDRPARSRHASWQAARSRQPGAICPTAVTGGSRNHQHRSLGEPVGREARTGDLPVAFDRNAGGALARGSRALNDKIVSKPAQVASLPLQAVDLAEVHAERVGPRQEIEKKARTNAVLIAEAGSGSELNGRFLLRGSLLHGSIREG
jgi:YD repeat-containing protein